MIARTSIRVPLLEAMMVMMMVVVVVVVVPVTADDDHRCAAPMAVVMVMMVVMILRELNARIRRWGTFVQHLEGSRRVRDRLQQLSIGVCL